MARSNPKKSVLEQNISSMFPRMKPFRLQKMRDHKPKSKPLKDRKFRLKKGRGIG